MITAKLKVEPKVLHMSKSHLRAIGTADRRKNYINYLLFRRILRNGSKINKRFVTTKSFLLMVLLLHKWLFLVASTVVHPLFVSVTEINHNAKDKTLEISCKVFTDDLEKAIEKSSNVKIDLFTIKDKAAANKAITDYFRKHLSLKADGKVVQMELVGFEREGDATWSYFQVSNIPTLKKLEVNNNILY